VTRTLPWCWKATTSPRQFLRGEHFDPRSRCFAFEGTRLVGYMSFTGHAAFVSLGYPWVLPGYEGELQEELYQAVYGFAAGREYGGKTFGQRFRRQWQAQIDFFKRHGFREQRAEPIFALDLASQARPIPSSRYRIEFQQAFRWEAFVQVAANSMPAEQLAMFRMYFETVEFDFALEAWDGDARAAYFGFALRSDTGFAELIATALEAGAEDAVSPMLQAAAGHLRAAGARFLATKLNLRNYGAEGLANLGFKKATDEVFLSKSI